MEDTAKYLIHADFVADGFIERTDVVGAVFGQTEGLLGDDLDIRDLQRSSKLGRIDVEVAQESGQSIGNITIASSLDRVETATLAAALEAIERIGPSDASVEVTHIEDVRAAKRRAIVDRAKELLATAFDEGVMDSTAILEEVRESIRVEDITEYAGLPAGPHVASSDAVIVVEGRADVLTLLKYGVKNAIAVEGTNVPESVAELTAEKTVTAFLDGDRGGDLILRELEQVGDVDYVAVGPEGKGVEDLSRAEVDRALRNKVPVAQFGDAEAAEPVSEAATDGSATPAPPAEDPPGGGAAVTQEPAPEPDEAEPRTLASHVDEVVDSGTVRLLGSNLEILHEGDASETFSAIKDAATVPRAVVIDGTVTQRIVDVASQRGVAEIVGTDSGPFVKQPTSVRVLTADQV